MANYVLAYTGGEMAETEEAIAAEMEKWNAWYGQLGEAIVDGGAPFGPSSTISSDGSVGGAGDLTGYTIVKADSLSDATAMAKGCPILAAGGGIGVYECIEM